MIAKIADLVKDKVITEISDLADHSDSTGMRIQVELKRDAIPQVVLNKLYKHTGAADDVRLQRRRARRRRAEDALAARAVTHYLDFQREIVTRRSKYELRKAEERAHVLEGYLIALDNLDAVIALIRAAGRHRRGARRS